MRCRRVSDVSEQAIALLPGYTRCTRHRDGAAQGHLNARNNLFARPRVRVLELDLRVPDTVLAESTCFGLRHPPFCTGKSFSWVQAALRGHECIWGILFPIKAHLLVGCHFDSSGCISEPGVQNARMDGGSLAVESSCNVEKARWYTIACHELRYLPLHLTVIAICILCTGR